MTRETPKDRVAKAKAAATVNPINAWRWINVTLSQDLREMDDKVLAEALAVRDMIEDELSRGGKS